jgi:tetratricopeptide (TPR) repeat protein
VAGGADDKQRRPLPRWRYTSGGVLTAEHEGDPRTPRDSGVDITGLELAAKEFHLEPTVATALELVHAAVAFNDPTSGLAAARYLERHLKRLPEELAGVLAWLSPKSNVDYISEQCSLVDVTSVEAASVVRSTRSRLLRDPRNVLYWLDSARAHAVLGNFEKAEAAMRRAVFLTPNHRLVLRAQARWLFHRKQAELAWRTIKDNPRTSEDPWLMAVEVSLAQVTQQGSVFAKRGRKLLASLAHEPAFVTELASAIGTLEWNAGSHKRGRKLLRQSLIAPTDNVVAQAEWFARADGALVSATSTLERPENMEARYWRALSNGKWDAALAEAVAWQEDEPYASRPAVNASFLAMAFLGEARRAVALARTGLRSNPDNQLLRNNYVVALVYAGQIDDAIRAFNAMSGPLQPDYPRFTYLATVGLLHQVTGEIDAGRRFFDEAARQAPEKERPRVIVARFEAESLVAAREAERLFPSLASQIAEVKGDPMLNEIVKRAIARHEERLLSRASQPVLVFPTGETVSIGPDVLAAVRELPR